jgi:hypothetical protein
MGAIKPHHDEEALLYTSKRYCKYSLVPDGESKRWFIRMAGSLTYYCGRNPFNCFTPDE